MKKNFIFNLWLLLVIPFVVEGKIQIPSIFSDNMVLQQNCDAALWGQAERGSTLTITTSWDHRSYTSKVNNLGLWKINITTPTAGGPYSITFKENRTDSLTLNNILIGEVWICSGQSNMGMPMCGNIGEPIENALDAIITSSKYYNKIRFYTSRHRGSKNPEYDNPGTNWKICEPIEVQKFSAVSFYFARYLAESLDVPVGIINCSWGSSNIEAWMDLNHNKTAKPDINLQIYDSKIVQKRPAYLYNGMICPIASYTARGFIWYQGEANTEADGYRWYYKQQVALIKNWRAAWNDNKMPFYMVQIAPYQYSNPQDIQAALIVEAQEQVTKTVPDCDLVSTTDIGNKSCIHPAQKEIVGLRLAYMVLSSTYKTISSSYKAPTYKNVTFIDNKAIIEFNNSTLGFMPIQEIKGFEIAGEDRIFKPATVSILKKGNTQKLCVSNSKIDKPVAVRYAFRNYIDANLCNTLGIAVLPFRTDNWE